MTVMDEANFLSRTCFHPKRRRKDPGVILGTLDSWPRASKGGNQVQYQRHFFFWFLCGLPRFPLLSFGFCTLNPVFLGLRPFGEGIRWLIWSLWRPYVNGRELQGKKHSIAPENVPLGFTHCYYCMGLPCSQFFSPYWLPQVVYNLP